MKAGAANPYRNVKLLTLLVLFGAVAGLAAYRRNVALSLERRTDALMTHHWICYAPTHYDPRRALIPSFASIRADLVVIKAMGFDGVITYECNGMLAHVPQVAEIGRAL